MIVDGWGIRTITIHGRHEIIFILLRIYLESSKMKNFQTDYIQR